jgi:hypothetical protein
MISGGREVTLAPVATKVDAGRTKACRMAGRTAVGSKPSARLAKRNVLFSIL